jgi:hypothetical protein
MLCFEAGVVTVAAMPMNRMMNIEVAAINELEKLLEKEKADAEDNETIAYYRGELGGCQGEQRVRACVEEITRLLAETKVEECQRYYSNLLQRLSQPAVQIGQPRPPSRQQQTSQHTPRIEVTEMTTEQAMRKALVEKAAGWGPTQTGCMQNATQIAALKRENRGLSHRIGKKTKTTQAAETSANPDADSSERAGGEKEAGKWMWLINPASFQFSMKDATTDIGRDVKGFNLKNQGYKNEEWPEVLRAVQFLREYEAYRAVRDGATPAVTEAQ